MGTGQVNVGKPQRTQASRDLCHFGLELLSWGWGEAASCWEGRRVFIPSPRHNSEGGLRPGGWLGWSPVLQGLIFKLTSTVRERVRKMLCFLRTRSKGYSGSRVDDGNSPSQPIPGIVNRPRTFRQWDKPVTPITVPVLG